MRAIVAALVAVCCLMVLPLPADARFFHHHLHFRWHTAHHHYRYSHLAQRRGFGESGELLPHPAGCPPVAFCGCGVALKVFGSPVRNLWLAANWLRFPRSFAQAGMVAVFGRHHVAYIESVHGDGTATVYDPNSGHHLTRLHRRSLAGATIVDPHSDGVHVAPRQYQHHRVLVASVPHTHIAAAMPPKLWWQ